jgi:non-ribosomal peptide synthetase component F
VKAGHPYIPVDVSIPADRILKIINSSKAELILNNSGTSVDTGDALISVVEPGVLEGDGVRRQIPDAGFTVKIPFTLSTHPEAREIQKACKSQPLIFRASQIGSRMTFRWKAAKCS